MLQACLCCGFKGGPRPDRPRECSISPMCRHNVSSSSLIEQIGIQPARDLDHVSEKQVETDVHEPAPRARSFFQRGQQSHVLREPLTEMATAQQSLMAAITHM